VTFEIKGDEYDRNIYAMTYITQMCLECAVLLDTDKMLLPVPIEVGKNFAEGTGERNLWLVDDDIYSEAILPLIVKAGEKNRYSILNLYQNWGKYPLLSRFPGYSSTLPTITSQQVLPRPTV
jgi:hypothetical protein